MLVNTKIIILIIHLIQEKNVLKHFPHILNRLCKKYGIYREKYKYINPNSMIHSEPFRRCEVTTKI